MIRHVRSARAWVAGRLAGRTKVKASLYYASSSIICQVLRFAGVILSTRLIDASQFGFFAQATLALSFANFVREIGQNNALVSYDGNDHRFIVFNFQINLVLGTLAGLALLLILKFVPGIPPELRYAAPLMAAITTCETLIATGLVVAQQKFSFRLIGIADITAVSSYLLTIFVLINRLEGFLVLLSAQLVEFVVRLLLLSFGDRWRFVGWCDGKDLRDYYFRKHAAMWIPQNLLQTASGRVDYMLLGGLSSVYELGIYERMLQFVRISWSLSVNLLDRVLVASYSKDQNFPLALLATLRKARRAILLAVICATGATTFAIVFLLDRVVGVSWGATILNHWWLASPFAIIVPLVWNNNLLLQATGNPRYLVIITLCSMTGELILGSLLVATGHGASGMFVARSLVYVAAFVLQGRIIYHLFGKRASPPSE